MGAQARRERWWLLGAFTLLALALRLPDIGNPLIDLDEQFYLLVGDRMRGGAIPYVDIWDRKPVGLFLLYWLARLPGGDPWVGYQLVASAFAVLTAWLIGRFAHTLAGLRAGLFAGGVYLVWIALLGGRGGQSPVFYDAAMAGAALATWRGVTDPAARRGMGLVALLLVGLALQIKPTVVFEGAWFGIALLIAAGRIERPSRVVTEGIVLVGVALTPTLVAFGVYAAIGHAQAWWFANVVSIFLRVTPAGAPIAGRLAGIALNLLVPFGTAVVGLSRLRVEGRWMIAGWMIAAIVGLLAVPPYFNHYALPLVVPIAMLAGIGMAASRPFALLVVAVGAGLLLFSGYPHLGERTVARTRLTALATTVNRYRGDSCLFAYAAPPALYQATGSCLPTRFPFGPHLTLTSEAPAIGVDPIAELQRILTDRPFVIVAGRPLGESDPRSQALVAQALRRDYLRVGSGLGTIVYARRDRVRPTSANNP